MNSSDWKKIIATVAPGLATVLGGPLAGAAVGALSKSILGKPDGSEEELAAVINGASPEVLAKIKETDARLKVDLANAGVRIEEIAANDRDSARKREVLSGSGITSSLAVLYTIAYFAALWAVWKFDIPKDAKDLLLVLLGGLTGAQLQILNYYFGSSSGSTEKNKLLSRLEK